MKSVESEGSTFIPTSAGRPVKRTSTSKLGEWQRFFLARLEYLLSRQEESGDADPSMAGLLSKAVYSTYLDCQDQGVGEDASQVLSAHGCSGPSAN